MKNKIATKKAIGIIAAILIVLVVAVMGAVLVSLYGTDSAGALNYMHSQQAFFIAEAGLERVLGKLKNESDFRENPISVNEDFGSGSYSVVTNKDATKYTITSIGIVQNANREVTLSAVIVPAVFGYAVFTKKKITLKDSVLVSGDFYSGRKVKVKAGASIIDGLVYAISVSGSGTYEAAADPPNPVPTYPKFDPTWYDDQISIAEDASGGSDLKLKHNESFDLGGGTYNFDKVELKDSASITGSGIIIAKRDVKLEDNASISANVNIYSKDKIKIKDSAVIADSVMFVAKKEVKVEKNVNVSPNAIIIAKEEVEVKDEVNIGDGAVLYSKEEVKLKDNVEVIGNLLTPDDKVKLEDNSILTGIIYAKEAELKDDSAMIGSLVVKKCKEMKKNVAITYDSGVLEKIPIGIKIDSGSVTVKTEDDWDEIY